LFFGAGDRTHEGIFLIMGEDIPHNFLSPKEAHMDTLHSAVIPKVFELRQEGD
jgi:hypothetical protein